VAVVVELVALTEMMQAIPLVQTVAVLVLLGLVMVLVVLVQNHLMRLVTMLTAVGVLLLQEAFLAEAEAVPQVAQIAILMETYHQ
jgi:hypothetical protein